MWRKSNLVRLRTAGFGIFLLAQLLATGCTPEGENGTVASPTAPGVQVQRAAVENLLTLYRQAMLQEDIDRLQELFPTASTLPVQCPGEGPTFQSPQEFQACRRDDLQRFLITNLQLPPETVEIAPDYRQVTFLEVESRADSRSADPASLGQHTRLLRTTFALARQDGAEVSTFRITAVRREGPLVQITTRGQALVGWLQRVEVQGTETPFVIQAGTLENPESGAIQPLTAFADRFTGLFTPSPQLPFLWVRLRSSSGQELILQHRYRVSQPDAGLVQKVAGTDNTRFYAVTVAADGTVWAGGDNGAALYQVPPGAALARREHAFHPDGRIEDLALDDLGRLHAVVLAPRESMVMVVDQGVLCKTVDVAAPAYPLRTPNGQPSASPRIAPAGGGALWLYGSDDGVTRVTDNFRQGQCPAAGASVSYAPPLRRQESGLLANVVPALVVEDAQTVWFGTALGLTRLQDGEFTPFLFAPTPSLQGEVTTLETFLRAIAEAIFATRPLTAVMLGGVSFVEAFGRPVVKEDFIYNAVRSPAGTLWAGTLGGGVRRLKDGEPARHFTRQDGFLSNIIFALAVDADEVAWVATDKGLSRLRVRDNGVQVRNFSALDGLQLPVRDVAVDAAGMVWLATSGGLFRLLPQGGVLQGVVHDPAGNPLAGIDVMLLGTSLRVVTDTDGRFVLTNVPPDTYRLFFDGQLAAAGAVIGAVRDVTVPLEGYTAPPVILARVEGLQLVRLADTFPPATVGTLLPQPLEVAVRDRDGHGVPNIPVTFAITAGDGQLSTTQPVLTNAQGQAAVRLLIGNRAGTMTVMATASALEAVSFTVSGQPDRQTARLITVSGNNQNSQQGDELPLPLVVRLEDQFQNPIRGEEIIAQLLQGEAIFLSTSAPAPTSLAQEVARATATVRTNAQGEASFRLQVGNSERDLVVEIAPTAPDLSQVEPVQFLAIIDTPDLPLEVAVVTVGSQTVAYVADRFAGLRIIDVTAPQAPVEALPIDLPGNEIKLATLGTYVFVATAAPVQLYVLDIATPLNPVPLEPALPFPPEVQSHAIRGLTVQDGFAYVVTDAQVAASGTLQIIDIQDPAALRIVGNVSFSGGRPQDVAVSSGMAYVPAETGGLLIFDVREAARPQQVGVLGDPEPQDEGARGAFFSSIAVAGNFAYLIESSPHLQSADRDEFFTVLDLTIPTAPRRRGTIRVRTGPGVLGTKNLAVMGDFCYLVSGAGFGLRAIDIHNPDAPRVLRTVATRSQALSVTTAGNFIYVTDQIFGLVIVEGPAGAMLNDTDGDGVIDFFDAFPMDATEFLDTDSDGLGDNVDPDDDQDGFTDTEELAADPRFADPSDPRFFPLRLPPTEVTTIVIDPTCPVPPVNAVCPIGPQDRNGTAAAPYRSLTEGLRVLRSGSAPQVETVLVRPGIYSPQTTQEIFPLTFDRLSVTPLTLRSTDPENPQVVEATVIDAGFTGNVMFLSPLSQHITIAGVTLARGGYGVLANTTHLTLRKNRIVGNVSAGLALGFNSTGDISDNLIEGNGQTGIELFNGSVAVLERNRITRNGGHGIAVGGSTAEILANTIIGNTAEGITVAGGLVTVLDNTISDNRSIGLYINNRGTSERGVNIVRRNRIVRNNYGIAVEGALAMITEHNRILDNVNIGIFILLGADVQVVGNTIMRSTLDGVQVRQAMATISGNTIRANGTAGIGVNEVQQATPVISRNLITGNRDGIIVQQALVRCTQNTIRDNNRDGIEVLQQANATLTTNTITDNGNTGVRIDASVARLDGGTIARNGRDGMALSGRARMEIGMATPRVLTVAENRGVGVAIARDGSLAHLDPRRIVFRNNRRGTILGPFTVVRDPDGDGLSNEEERLSGTASNHPDSDGDGLLDGFEVRHSLAPLDARDGRADPDQDGLHNGDEQRIGTDPQNADTDNDGLADGAEQSAQTDPLNADTDGDGLTDNEEIHVHHTDPFNPDTDGDGVSDAGEVALAADPLTPERRPYTLSALPVDGFPVALEVGDLNGDQRLDLVTVHALAHHVSVWLGNGRGGFTANGTFPVGDTPIALGLGDFDTDGVLDLAVANRRSNDVAVLFGNGQGSFTETTSFLAGRAPSALALGDFDRDGALDLAVVDTVSNDISVLLGDGRGGFTRTAPLRVRPGSRFLTSGDFNGDTVPDLVVVNASENSISVFNGDGRGGFILGVFFAIPVPQSFSPVPQSVSAVVSNDFDGDQHADLALANSGGNGVVLFGTGAGTFLLGGFIPTGFFPSALAAGDFDQDGRADLAVANAGDNTVTLLLSRGRESFPRVATFPVGRVPGALVVGDFNGDDRPDIAVTNMGDNTVSLLLSQ